jgi:hypothetical protein
MRSTVGSALLLAMWVMLVLAPAAAHATGSGPPVNSVLPKISGTAQDGQTLKAAKGTWTGSATITYTYQWHLCDNTGQNCTNIPLATKTSYKLGHETVGHTLRVIVIATNTLGKASATSAPSAVVAPVPPHETKLPAIKGTPKVGALLTASTGTWTGTPPITYGYQWEACNSTGEACGAIAGATTATFTPGPTQAAATLRVVVGAGNVAGYASATSVPTKAVIPQACTISWTGNAGTSTWVTAGNWSPARLPSSTDVVCVAGSMLEAPVVYAGGTTKIAELVTTRPLSVTGGELSVTSTTTPSFVTDLTLAGGALTGEGALTIEGASEWSGGALGFRSATVSAGSSLQLISGHGEPIVASGRTLANNGTVTVEGSTGLRLEGSARVVNSGTFDFLGEGGIRYSGSFPPYLDSIVNSGVFEKTAGSTNEISGIFDNTGTVSVSSGGMWLDGPSSSGQGDTGSYTTTSSGHVVFYVETGDRTLAPASKLTGNVEWATGLLDGTVSAGSSLQLISGHGEPIVASGRTLANNGTVTVEGSTGLRLEGSARVVNSGTFDFLGEGGIRYSGSFPPYLDSIVNSGVFEKTAGSTNEISGIFDNTGTVSVSSGGMWLDGPSSSGQGDTGSYTTTSSGHVVFYVETGDRTLAPASKLTGNVEWATGLLDGTVSAGSSLQLISGHGEPIVASGRTLTIAGTLVAASSTTLPVEPGSHVAFAAGSAFKAGTAAGIRVMPEGDLTAEGVAGAPVSFTSANDNSVGGTTGSGSPAPGDWSGIEAQSGSTVSLTGASLRYASTALYVAEEAEATIHGKLLNDTVGVSSPGAYVDATEVDWGSSSGPAPIGSGTPVEGDGVLVIPWVGYRAPPKPPPPQITNPPTNTCPAVFFIGVRGSGEYSREREPYSTQTADQERLLGSKIGWAYKAVQDALAPQTVQPVAVEYPALPFLGSNVGKDIQVVWSLANTEYVDNLWEGAWVTEGVLGDAEANCPTSKIILAGYSSGAFAVHEGLNNLTSAEAKRVAAVILLADPSKLRPGEEPKVTTEGTAKTSADGIYTKTFGNGLGDLTGINPTKIPQSVEAKTISWCNDHDPVCAFGKGIKPSVHSAYSQSELEYLGNWAAQRYEAGS